MHPAFSTVVSLMIEAVCVCGKRIQVQDEHAGVSIKCPKCRKLVAVAPSTADPPGEPLASAGVSTDPGAPESLPPPGLFPDAFTPAPVRFGDASSPEHLLGAVERLTAVCQGIRVLLAGILGVLVAHSVLSFFHR